MSSVASASQRKRHIGTQWYENLVAKPAPQVRFVLMGESSLDFELQAWAKMPSLRGLTVHQLNKSIYNELNRAGISIPFPQRDVHIYREPEKE